MSLTESQSRDLDREWEARTQRLENATAKRRPSNILTISIERDEPLCGEPASGNTHEYEVEVEYDGGHIHSSVIVSRFDSHTEPTPVARIPVTLTKLEAKRAWNDWMRELADRDSNALDARDDARFERWHDGGGR